jgi:molybdopterin/thiamine biosynthesis adenylyltransferase
MADHVRPDRHLDHGAAGSPVHLLPGLLASPGHVTVLIGDQDATTPRGQLLIWTTANLLLRCYGVLATVTVHCPDVLLSAPLPRTSVGSAPLSLHQALTALAAAIADPDGRGPCLVIQPGDPACPGADTVTLVLGTQYAGVAAGSRPGNAAWVITAGAWKLCIASLAALTHAHLRRLPRLDEDGPVSVAVWLASALGCAEAFKKVGQLKEGRGRAIEAFSVNLWTLAGSDGFGELGTADGPADPPQLPAHYVVGAGAVSEAYLAILATSDVSTALALLDDDVLGDTNLNRHILAAWADLGQHKATLAQDRLSGYRMRIFPVNARWQDYLATPPAERPARPEALTIAEASGMYDLVISAVDRNRSRVAIAGVRPEVILGGSTNGLEAEVGRYRAGSGWQCMACASPLETRPSIEQAVAQLAEMTSAELATLAQEQGLDMAAITEYLKRPACGTLGEREVQRFATLARPDWSVSFVSVASGALLAARALTHIADNDAERTAVEGDTLRIWLANATMARSAHQRNPDCPVCGATVRVPVLTTAR